MKIFLLWRRTRDDGQMLDVERIASNLQKVFAPLFGTPPKQRILQSPGMAMVVWELPVRGWIPPFFQESLCKK